MAEWNRPRHVDKPEPGFFEMRLVKGGPLVGARIVHEDGLWSAWIDGAPCGPPHPDPVYANGVYRIWHNAAFSDELSYNFRMELRAWALKHDPEHWAARPQLPVNLPDRPSLF